MSGAAPFVLRTHGLAKSYGTVEAVSGLDLAVRRGEIYGFLGPNGAGKTTTLLMLLGVEQPTGGTIERFGRAGPIDPFRDKPRIGVLGEQQHLYDDLSAWEYLLFFGRLYRVERPEGRARELLERLDLDEFHRLRARDFSRGMQQKLGLARALLHRPELLVLDEPVSGLDPHGIRQVREILAEENHRGVTILVSSHILSEVERTAHRVGILSGGRLVAEDEVAQLVARLEPDTLIELDVEQLGPGAVESLREQPFVRAVDLVTDGGGPGRGLLRVRVAADVDHRRDVSAVVAQHGGLITGMRQPGLSLEEAFVRLTGDEGWGRHPPGSAGLWPVPGGAGESDPPGAEFTQSTEFARPGTGQRPALPGSRDESDPPLTEMTQLTKFAPAGGRRWVAIWTIARRDVLGMLYGPGIYVVVALGMLATLPVVRSYLDAVERNRVLVLADPFSLPFFVAATIAMLFLALASVATIARERDQGTLEVLFYGPVDHGSYVLGKHLGQVLAYLPMGLGLAALFLSYAAMTGLRLGGSFVAELALSLFTAAAVAAVGVLLSTLARGVRAGIALLGGLTVLFLAIRFGSELLSGIRVANNSSPLLFLRELAIFLDHLAGYVSPFSVFQSGVDAVVRGDGPAYLAAVLLLCLQCAALLAASVRLLGRRGVRR